MALVKQSYAYTGNNQLCCVTTPAPRDAWEALLEKDENALVTQTPNWLDCVCEIEHYEDASRLYEIPGRGSFVLPMVRSKKLPRIAASLYSYPNSWGMGGLIGDAEIQPQDVEVVIKDLLKLPGVRKLIRPNPLVDKAWRTPRIAGLRTIPRLAHVLDLREGFDKIWSRKFATNTRRNVRKAESSGLIIECDRTGKLVPVFYGLFAKSVDRWADQQNEPYFLARFRARRRDPWEKFERIARNLQSACRIWVAWHHGEPAAAILVLQSANAHYTRGVMDKEIAGPTRANDLLHHHAIEEACRAGCHFYHMGETGQSETLARFKSRFGAVPVPYSEYLIERLPISEVDKRLREMIKKSIGFKDV